MRFPIPIRGIGKNEGILELLDSKILLNAEINYQL